MPACVRRHDMVLGVAFVHHPATAHPLKSRVKSRILRSSRSSKPACTPPTIVRPRFSRVVPVCNTGKPPQNPGSAENSHKSEEPSRTIAGRIAVEVLSLIVGAVLILMVVAWRVCQVVSLNVWRAFVWLSNVRQLGKWAVGRVANADGIALPITSFRKLVSRIYGSTISSIMRIGQEAVNRSVVETPPVQEEKRQEIEVREAEQLETLHRDSATAVPVAVGRRLILLRHAKTTWDRDSEIPDHDRVLSAKGKEEARLVGRELEKTSWLPDVVLCSDAVRTVQTLSLLDIPDQNPAYTTCTESLYYAVTGDEMAHAIDDALGDKGFTDDTTLMVVCHNPGCEEVVEQLTGHRLDMGTGCAALLEYEGDSEPTADDESERFRRTPRFIFNGSELVFGGNVMSSWVELDRFYLLSGEITMDALIVDENGQNAECEVQNATLQGSCLWRDGLQRVRLWPVTQTKTISILGNRFISLLYAIPRVTHDVNCTGLVSATISCAADFDENRYSVFEHFTLSPSQPVTEVVIQLNAVVGKPQKLDRRDVILGPAMYCLVACILVCLLVKTLSWLSFAMKGSARFRRIVEHISCLCNPLQRKHIILSRQRFSPWDSTSDSDNSEIHPKATITLYNGAYILAPENRY